MKYRIGTVPYLNALPLHRTLSRHADVRLQGAVPAVLSAQLAAGEHDVALIPVVEHFRGTGDEIISDACIGSSRQVRSVLVFHRCPVRDIGTIALDADSRTSVAMQEVVLADAFGVRPERGVLSPNLNDMMREHDAALIIGDPALESRSIAAATGIEILDLGEAWTKLTGLPFVYAAWVTRQGLDESTKNDLADLLNVARDEGKKLVGEIARDNPTNLGIPTAEIESYLSVAIEHTLTPAHRSGLDEFRRRCVAHGLA